MLNVKRKKIISVLLTAVLCAGLFSNVVFAAEVTDYNGYTFTVWANTSAERGASFSGSGTTAWGLVIKGAGAGSTFTLEAAENGQYYIFAKFHGVQYYLTAVSASGNAAFQYYLKPTSSKSAAACWTLEKGKFYTWVGSTKYLLYMYWNQSPYNENDAFRLTSNLDYDDPVYYTCMDLTPPHVHSFTDKQSNSKADEATCTEAAKYYVQCDGCNEISDTLTVSGGEPAGHSFGDWETVTAADYVTGGLEKRTCSRTDCGEEETRSIPATGPAVLEEIGIVCDFAAGTVHVTGVPEDIVVWLAVYEHNQMCQVQFAANGAISFAPPAAGSEVRLFFLTSSWQPIGTYKAFTV